MLTKILTVTEIHIAKDHAAIVFDGYNSGEAPTDYSYGQFRVPLGHEAKYRVGQSLQFTVIPVEAPDPAANPDESSKRIESFIDQQLARNS